MKFLIAFPLLGGTLFGATFYASPSGDPIAPCTETDPCTLQTAITNTASSSSPGEDTIKLMPGTYTIGATITGSSIDGVIIEASDPSNKPVLDASSAGVQILDITASGNVIIRNIIFKGGNTSSDNGGALKISSDSASSQITAFTIESCEFINNRAVRGGALWFNETNANVTIRNSIFDNNQAQEGGAVYVNANNLTIQNSKFSNNRASGGTGNGGGISATVQGSSTVKVEFSAFFNNSADTNGGAIYGTGGASVAFVNNLIYDNTSRNLGGGAYWSIGAGKVGLINNTVYSNGDGSLTPVNGGGAYIDITDPSGEAYTYNNIFWNNTSSGGGDDLYINTVGAGVTVEIVSNVHGPDPVNDVIVNGATPTKTGNKTTDPAFKNPPSDLDIGETSSAIDIGDTPPTGSGFTVPGVDYEGTPRPIDGDGTGVSGSTDIDAGAYEFGYVLSVTKGGTGIGTVRSNDSPPTIDCGFTCTRKVDKGANITLEISGLVNSRFDGWGDACASCGTSTSCTLTGISADTTCSATFTYIGGDGEPSPAGCGPSSGGGGGENATGCSSATAGQWIMILLTPAVLILRRILRGRRP